MQFQRCCADVCAVVFALGLSAAASASGDDRVTSQTDLVYVSRPTGDVRLDVYFPPPSVAGNGARPGILFVHGGGWVAGNKRDYRSRAIRFAREGYVGFSVDYRLVTPDGQNRYPSQLDDVQAAVRFIRAHAKEYGVDPARVGAMGDSAGGHLVSLLGTCDTRATESVEYAGHSSRVACVVDLYGPADLTVPLPTEGPFGINVQQLVNDLVGGSESERPELARAASPVFHVDEHSAPFLIIQGTEDVLVPVDQSKALHEVLRANGVESELLILEKEGHGIGPQNEERVFRKQLEFFDRHLRKRGR